MAGSDESPGKAQKRAECHSHLPQGRQHKRQPASWEITIGRRDGDKAKERVITERLRRELCLILGDAVFDQAAFVASLMASTPSLKVTPSMTLGKGFGPRRRSQFFSASRTSLKTMRRAVSGDSAPLVRVVR